MGLVGTADGLAKLKKLSVPEDKQSQQQLSFAKLLIGIRIGSKKQDSQSTNDALGIRWTTHEAKALEPTQVQDLIAAIGGATYGITLNSDMALEFDCGNVRHFVFLNRDLKQSEFIKSICSVARIVGVVALEQEKEKYLSVRYLILTVPDDDEVHVIVTTTNGNVVYAGRACPDGKKLRVKLRDLGLERTPTEIEGLVSDNGIRLNLRAWQGVRKKKSAGKPFLN